MPGENQNRNNRGRESVGMTGSYSARRKEDTVPQIQLIDISRRSSAPSGQQRNFAPNSRQSSSSNNTRNNANNQRKSNNRQKPQNTEEQKAQPKSNRNTTNRTGSNFRNPAANRAARLKNPSDPRNKDREELKRNLPPFNHPVAPLLNALNNNRKKNQRIQQAGDEGEPEEEEDFAHHSRPDFLGLRNRRRGAKPKNADLMGEMSGLLKKVLMIFMPTVLAIMVVMSFCLVVMANENQFLPLFGINSKTGGQTGGIEYTDSPEDEEAFFERVKKINDEYKQNGKSFDAELIGAAYFIIQSYNEKITMDSMDEDAIRKIADAMFDSSSAGSASVYKKDTFIKNLVNDVLPEYIPGLDEDAYEEIAEEMFDYIDSYKELIEADTTTAATGGVVGGNILYWWPVGSAETTEENGVTFAKGNPTSTEITSYFAGRVDPFTGEVSTHTGMDLTGANSGYGVENVIAALDGVVVYPTSKANATCPSGSDGGCGGGYGNYVVIQHSDGNFTLYAHMHSNTITVQAGDTVKQGQVIGKMGSSGRSTGTHLHFEVRKGANLQSSTVDPLDYIDPNNPRPMSTGSSGFSLEQSSLSKAEFVAKMNDYCSRSGDSNFCTNFAPHAESIYDTAHAAGVNPELVVVTAGKEQGWGLGCGYNFYGIGIPNGAGCSAGPSFASLEDGIRGYAETLAQYRPGGSMASAIEQRYNEREAAGCDPAGHGMPGTLQGMQSVYSWIGDYRYNPGDWGSGGCVYLTIIYGDSYPYCKPETAAVDNVTPTTVCEQNDYTAWQLQGKFELRQEIFGL